MTCRDRNSGFGVKSVEQMDHLQIDERRQATEVVCKLDLFLTYLLLQPSSWVLVTITVERADQTTSCESPIHKKEDTHFFSCLYCVLILSGFSFTLWIQTHLHERGWGYTLTLKKQILQTLYV
ncbi:LOW QUALITY PROTEIN: hypothetical protein MAR_023275 [Mya arenaria]|uniref:Uncharacterized protein n=1 Tax=Mya arenaria TaxID=6604 RepID=A0ABY7DMJ7_MYAAR|nr:LOW QUALITY PROTEIN: hypothetical protein MAR_023275 [Mya arenaria]